MTVDPALLQRAAAELQYAADNFGGQMDRRLIPQWRALAAELRAADPTSGGWLDTNDPDREGTWAQ